VFLCWNVCGRQVADFESLKLRITSFTELLAHLILRFPDECDFYFCLFTSFVIIIVIAVITGLFPFLRWVKCLRSTFNPPTIPTIISLHFSWHPSPAPPLGLPYSIFFSPSPVCLFLLSAIPLLPFSLYQSHIIIMVIIVIIIRSD